MRTVYVCKTLAAVMAGGFIRFFQAVLCPAAGTMNDRDVLLIEKNNI